MLDNSKSSNITHGLSNTAVYKIWTGIKQRCYNNNHPLYQYYGSRGITVCDEWRDSFEAFYRDMGLRPSLDHSVDRKDNNKGYYKENCYWATRVEQQNNKRNTPFYEIGEERKSLAGWCRELLLDYAVINRRLRTGWSFEEAIAPKGLVTDRLNFELNGETKPLKHWCEIFNLNYRTVYTRIKEGMLFEVAIKIDKLARNTPFTFNETTNSIGEWCDLHNVKFTLFCSRLYSGWTFWEALQPIEQRGATIDGQSNTLEFWCRLLGLDEQFTYLRVLRGELFDNIVRE